MRLILAISIILLVLNGCSTLNPGYSSKKPNLSKVIENKTTYKEIKSILGDPAISQISRGKIKLKYFYNIEGASVSQTQMIKGDYSAGCKGCGKIYLEFRQNSFIISDNSLLYSIKMDDSSLKSTFNKGMEYVSINKFEKGLPYIKTAANNHYEQAEHVLGLMYIKGDGVEKNYQQAYYWFSKAARAGNISAMYDVGAMIYNGEGVKADKQKAMNIYIMVAEKGHVMAMKELVKIYHVLGNTLEMNKWLQNIENANKK